MRMPRGLALTLLVLLPFSDACGELKRLAYDDLGRRDEWQEPERVIESLDLRPGQKIADLGAGGGYFTFRLADAVGRDGVVYAIDVDEDMLGRIDELAKERGLTNVRTVVAQPEDPGLPEAVDLIFVSNTYHHLEDRSAYFGSARRHLRAGGRIAVLEYGNDGALQSCAHGTKAENIRSEMQAAGYTLTEEFDFTTRQSFQIFAVDPQ